MTATLLRPRPTFARTIPLNSMRLLRTELRRNTMPLILPLIAALFWFDSYRPSTATEPLYGVRTFWNMGQGHTIIDFGPFVAGVAAWMASRDSRRGLADLVSATARPRWIGHLVTWAATAIWAAAAYLLFVGIMFAWYAHQGVAGTPPWWSVAVGAAAVTAFSAAGFAVGAFWPSRFAAPIAAFGGFLAMVLSSQTGFHHASGWAIILPTNSNGSFDGSAQTDSGIFYPWLPDLPIARIIFLVGIAVAVIGLTGLPARAGGRRLRQVAVVVTLAGVALTGTAVRLATTAQISAGGVVIPALHDAANDQPIAYTPVCDQTAAIPVCVNPSYDRWLRDVTIALAPELSEVAGLPGAPVRAVQVPAAYPSGNDGPPQLVTLGGQPVQLRLSLGLVNLPGPCGFCSASIPTSDFIAELQVLFAHAFVDAGDDIGSPVQQAVQAALLHGAGVAFADQPRALSTDGLPPWAHETGADGPDSNTRPAPASDPIYAAAQQLAALPTAAWRAWLATNLAAVQAGHLTLAQLP
jgi:hypothetical protein